MQDGLLLCTSLPSARSPLRLIAPPQSIECQKRHWSTHRQDCKQLALKVFNFAMEPIRSDSFEAVWDELPAIPSAAKSAAHYAPDGMDGALKQLRCSACNADATSRALRVSRLRSRRPRAPVIGRVLPASGRATAGRICPRRRALRVPARCPARRPGRPAPPERPHTQARRGHGAAWHRAAPASPAAAWRRSGVVN
ncbi:hypothetical protein BV25DRAFT_1462974 [Artomyces pyxidatus]|uniref:Uncharacterized protein n=1 Tax=Artomyces pyxidatus TaxID=48021 RepID=A0ACB8SM54_9AGAM|nr:hypothetical protein BV25DRAFT_1462974 [Artomyces pyxidatus]